MRRRTCGIESVKGLAPVVGRSAGCSYPEDGCRQRPFSCWCVRGLDLFPPKEKIADRGRIAELVKERTAVP